MWWKWAEDVNHMAGEELFLYGPILLLMLSILNTSRDTIATLSVSANTGFKIKYRISTSKPKSADIVTQ